VLGNSAQRLLVIRLSAMGDVAMMVPVLLALIKSQPGLHITVLTRKSYDPILNAVPGIHICHAEVEGRHRGLPGILKLARELRKERFDAVADLHNVLRSNVLRLLFLTSRIPFVQLDKGRAAKRALTALHGKDFRQLKSMHQRYAEVFEKMGYATDLDTVTLLPREKLKEKIWEAIGADNRKWIGIAPFAAFPGKCYPAALMGEVLGIISKTDRYKIILFGGGTLERIQLDAWASQFGSCISVAGKFTLAEELALISNLDLMVSMDSANGHMAANYGVPVLTLWGLTHPFAGFAPFRQPPGNALMADRSRYPAIPTSVYGKSMPAGYEAVMETIAPAEVAGKIEELLRMGDRPLRH
jgi:ADP-heptose:LPS heptosyltransferase